MTRPHLSIYLSPRRIETRDYSGTSKTIPWAYLGKQFHEKVRLEQELGSSYECLDIAHIHNDVAAAIREEFNVWMDGLNRMNGSAFEWWMGSVSSRNVYRSDIYQFCCYVEILAALWSEPAHRPAFVVVESPALAKVIERWATAHGITVSRRGWHTAFPFRMKGFGEFILRWGNAIITLCLRKGASLVLADRSSIPVSGGGPTVIIHTYLHPASLSSDGVFSDRYFPFLYDYLKRNGKSILVIPTYSGFRYNFLPLFYRMRRSRTKFVALEQCLTITDIFHAFCYPFHLLFGKCQSTDFRGNNYHEVLREDTLLDNFEDSLDAILTYRLVARLAHVGMNPERLIDWYENQPINRALSAGFRKYFPGVPIIGVQSFLHYSNFLSLSPIVSEIEAGVIPDRLLGTSAYQCTQATMFAPGLECKPSAALRYAYLFSDNCELDVGDSQSRTPTILLLASFDLDETLELVSQIQQISDDFGPGIRLLIKLHPDMGKNTLVARYGPDIWPEEIKIVTGSLLDAMLQASVVISKSSGSIVEAAALGVPVIFFGSQTKLNLNPLAGIDLSCISECYTPEELKHTVKRYLNLTVEERVRCKIDSQFLRDMFFTKVSDDTLSPFLN